MIRWLQGRFAYWSCQRAWRNRIPGDKMHSRERWGFRYYWRAK